MSAFKKLNRREFLTLTGKSTGALVIGSSFAACVSPNSTELSAKQADPAPKDGDLGVFVNIQANGDVDIICHRAEMGQGILTSVPQIIADELGADWSRVTAVLGNADKRYGSQNTGGSASIRNHMKHTQQMGAIARDMLEQAAANLWSVEKSSVSTNQHMVSHAKSGQSIGFGELALAASKLAVPEVDTLTLKEASEFKLIGRDVAIQGMEKIVTGQATYAQDIQLPGMLIASIERPPVVGGKVKSFDASQAKMVAGVVDVIQLKERSLPVNVKPVSGIAVLASNTWAAIEGRAMIARLTKRTLLKK